ncbi:MAG TPA: class I SAM-dependent methyltransferase [Micromonosporaceae bacterium]|nr:class I SAM-dependent methyltransferase [Micromonosporaceae bacterium]
MLDPDPADQILEIGCGPGVAAGLVCERLSTGQLLAIDRSAVAIGRAGQRNATHVAAGRLTLRQSTLAGLSVPPDSLDKAFAIDVNLFWVGDPDPELDVLRRVLRPGAVLQIGYGASGPTGPARVLDTVSAALRAQGFTDVTAIVDSAGFGITARAPGSG